METTEGIPPLPFIKKWMVTAVCILREGYQTIFVLRGSLEKDSLKKKKTLTSPSIASRTFSESSGSMP